MKVPYSFYLYLLKNVNEKFDGGFTESELSNYFAKWNIPKQFRWTIIREMIILDYLIDNDGILYANKKVAKRKCSITKIYAEFGSNQSSKPVGIGKHPANSHHSKSKWS